MPSLSGAPLKERDEKIFKLTSVFRRNVYLLPDTISCAIDLAQLLKE